MQVVGTNVQKQGITGRAATRAAATTMGWRHRSPHPYPGPCPATHLQPCQ